MRAASVFWALLAATLALYLVIVLWSLPLIASEAGGLKPFDLRPLGYGLDETRAFLLALSDRGRDFYLGTQRTLDRIYPALLGATFALGFTLLFSGPLRWALILLALCVTGFDWLENGTVAGLLRTGPDLITVDQVSDAARWSVLKSSTTTIAWIALTVGGILALVRRRRARPPT